MGREATLEAWSKTSIFIKISYVVREFEDFIKFMMPIFLVSWVQPSLITYLEKSFSESYHLGLKWM